MQIKPFVVLQGGNETISFIIQNSQPLRFKEVFIKLYPELISKNQNQNTKIQNTLLNHFNRPPNN